MEKNYALIDDNNNIVNVIILDDSLSEEVKNQIIQSNGAVLSILVEDPRYNYNGGHYENGILWIPKPCPSWTKDLENNTWIPPIPYPDDNKNYFWNEDIVNWEEVSE